MECHTTIEKLQFNADKSIGKVILIVEGQRSEFQSNPSNTVDSLIKKFSNAQDNNEDMNGLLLLSYPSSESYIISNFCKDTSEIFFHKSKEAKTFCKQYRYRYQDITSDTMLQAIVSLHKALLNFGINSYDPSDFLETNQQIFNNEEKFSDNSGYRLLSLISLVFVDLGIIQEMV